MSQISDYGKMMTIFLINSNCDPAASTHEFIDSLFTILHFFQTSTHIGNMIVGAGVVSLLVDFVKNTRRDRLSVRFSLTPSFMYVELTLNLLLRLLRGR